MSETNEVYRQTRYSPQEKETEQLEEIIAIERFVRLGNLHIALMLPERYERTGIPWEKALEEANKILDASKPKYLDENRNVFHTYYEFLTSSLDLARTACPLGKRTYKIHKHMMEIEHTADQILDHAGNDKIPELVDDRTNLTHQTIDFLACTKEFEQYHTKDSIWGEFLSKRNIVAKKVTNMLSLLIPLEFQIIAVPGTEKCPEGRDYVFLLSTS